MAFEASENALTEWDLLVRKLDHSPDAFMTSGTESAAAHPMARVVTNWSERRSLDAKSLRNGHKVLMRGEPGAGEFRRGGACHVRCRHTGATIYTPPAAEKLATLIDDLLAFVASKPAPTLVKAFVALLQLLLIHPFKDGNGRCARALFAAICARDGLRHPLPLLALLRLYGDGATRLHAGSAVLRATGDWRVYLDYCRQCLAEAARFPQRATVIDTVSPAAPRT